MAYKPVVGDVMSSPNVIPMADIMLVLLIIFMVVTPMLQKGVSVDLAQVSNPREMPNADRDDAVVVAITRDGKVFFGNDQTPPDQLTQKIKDRIANKVDKRVYIRADARARFAIESCSPRSRPTCFSRPRCRAK